MRAVLVALAALILAGTAGAATQPRVLAIQFGPDLEINPVTQGYLTSELSRAASDHYDAAVILLDTPGGLSTSMKTIFTAELNAKLPVIVYVSPNGARAASAGVWVSQAADVLAMAPTTNIGSSTPIDSSGANLGSDLRRKVINDSVASLTALAATHHRNTQWPAKAVRVASNLTASQALKMHVIDLIAPTLPALLNRLNGYRTKDAQRPFTLHLAGAHIDTVKPGFVTRFLNTIIDPNLISILFLAGIVGLIFEVLHPGIVLPGALGAVSLVLALYGFSVLQPELGRCGAHPARRRVARHRPARDDARGADHRRGDRARLRHGIALPEPACALPRQHVSHRQHRQRDRALLELRARQGACRPAAARDRRARRRSSASAARFGRPGSSSSTASCGRRRPRTIRSSSQARKSRSRPSQGLELTVTPSIARIGLMLGFVRIMREYERGVDVPPRAPARDDAARASSGRSRSSTRS